MNEVTATAGGVVVPKGASVPNKPLPKTYIMFWWEDERWYSLTCDDSNIKRLIDDGVRHKQAYCIVHIPGEEVKDGK